MTAFYAEITAACSWRWLITAAAPISRRPAFIKLSLAEGHARPLAVVAGERMTVAALIVLVLRCCGSALIKLTLAEVGWFAPKARCFGLLTRKATAPFSVSRICTVCNTFAVIKPLRRVHLHRLCPRRKVR